MKKIIKKIEAEKGNVYKANNYFISTENIKLLIKYLENNRKPKTLLITPYLIDDNATYELNRYELVLEVVSKKEKSKFAAYDEQGVLPPELFSEIKARMTFLNKDIQVLVDTLSKYFMHMEKNKFEEERNDPIIGEKIKNAKLFYQIF